MLRLMRYLVLILALGGIGVASGYSDAAVAVLIGYFIAGFWFGAAWRPVLRRIWKHGNSRGT